MLIKPWYFLPVRQKKLFKIWSAIIEEYLKELKPELHEEHKKLQKRKAQALIDILQNFEYGTMGNMESRLKLEEILIDLDKFQNKIKKIGKEKDRTDSLLLEKYKTFLDKKNISVRQYHNYIAELYARN